MALMQKKKTSNPAQINEITALTVYHWYLIQLTTKNEVINCSVLVDVHIPQRHS